MEYRQAQVPGTAAFDASMFPDVMREIRQIRNITSDMPDVFKEEMLISFAKDHCLRMEWIKANPDFAGMMTCGALPIRNIEQLFSAAGENPAFCKELETCLKASLHGD